jgi:hypothetical protein
MGFLAVLRVTGGGGAWGEKGVFFEKMGVWFELGPSAGLRVGFWG